MRRTNFILGKCLELLSSMQRFIELTLVYGTGLSSYLPSSPESITTERWSKGLCFNCHIQNHAFEFIRTKLVKQLSSFIAWLFLPHLSLVVFCSRDILYLELWRIHLSGSCDSHALIVFLRQQLAGISLFTAWCSEKTLLQNLLPSSPCLPHGAKGFALGNLSLCVSQSHALYCSICHASLTTTPFSFCICSF